MDFDKQILIKTFYSKDLRNEFNPFWRIAIDKKADTLSASNKKTPVTQ